MEPEYHNGEIAWIQQKDSICNGEVGIFYLYGEAYIKKLHDEPDGLFLFSLNKKYKPIAIQESDSFKIFGRIERGERNPSLEMVIRLAHYLNMSVEEIFKLDDGTSSQQKTEV